MVTAIITSTKTTTAKAEVCLTKGKQTSCPFSQEGFEEPKVQRKELLLAAVLIECRARESVKEC